MNDYKIAIHQMYDKTNVISITAVETTNENHVSTSRAAMNYNFFINYMWHYHF